ncbi:porin family protein [Spirosoma pulveris]
MKSIHSFLALLILPVSLSFAQTKPQATTPPASNTATGGSTNRMQDLYDEHHGINRKAKTATPARTETQQPGRAADQTETGISQPERMASAGSASGTRIGFRGGVTYPLFLEKQAFTDPALGFVGGVTFNFGAGPVSFQPEINYARKATKITQFGYTDTYSTDALEIPLLVKFSTGTYAGNRFFVNVGPYAAYAISSGINGKTISLDGAKGRFGFGGALGVGAALKAGPGHVTVEVRGLYPLGNNDIGFDANSKTIVGQGTVGYSFPLGGR